MFSVRLRVPPACYDEYDQPCYPVQQTKGLFEFGNYDLMAKSLAEGYDAADAAVLFHLIKREVQEACPGQQSDIVEIGGGNGHFFDNVEELARSYINIEPGKIRLDEKGLRRLQNGKYQCIKCSAEELPLLDECADIVLSCGALDHIPSYEKSLAEINRVLRKDGFFIVQLNNRRSWWKILLSGTEYLRQREQEIAKEHYIQWSLPECEDNLSDFIPLIKIYSTTFFPYVPKVWKWCLPVFNLVGRSLLPKYGGNTIAVCRKIN